MTYLQQQRHPLQTLPGLAAVVLLHVALIYALVNGLRSNIVEHFARPMTLHVVDQIKPPPPPPPPATPHIVTPQTMFVPPPDVQIQAPKQPDAPVVTSHTHVPPALPLPAAPAQAEYCFSRRRSSRATGRRRTRPGTRIATGAGG
jgi:periplasmic protein TonB